VSSLTLAALLQISLLTTSDHPYAEAHKLQLETGCPLVVLVGADWCPACVTMKNSVIPQAQRQGVLSNVAFAQVNTDHEPELSKQLMRGGLIPRLIVYHKTVDGWQRKELAGAQSVDAIEELISEVQSGPVAATARIGR
jgi:thioredoxin-like negative regulator of GroEL